MSWVELELVRGDTIKFTVTCTRPDDEGVQQPIDLTGAQLRCTLKKRRTDADEDAFIALESPFGGPRGIQILNQTTNKGQAQVVAAAGESSEAGDNEMFYIDVQVRESNGEVYTPVAGTVTFRPDVTFETT